LHKALFLVCALGLTASCEAERTGDSAKGSLRRADEALGSAPRTLLLTTIPGTSESSLVWSTPGAPLAPPVARIRHAADADARGVLLPNGDAAVVADVRGGSDLSFAAALFVVRPPEVKLVVEDCVHASRPFAMPNGKLLVQRGSRGSEPPPAGALRTDELRLDEVDPNDGSIRTLHSFAGYITFVAAVSTDEAFVYRVAMGHADLVAIALSNGAQRVLASPIVAQARDFSFDAKTHSLVYTNLDSSGWYVERLFTDSGARTEVARAGGMWVTPHVWPGGGVLLNDGRGAVVLGASGPERPFGEGFDELRALSPNQSHAALLHHVPSDFSLPFVVDVASGKAHPLPAPAGSRVDILGVAP